MSTAMVNEVILNPEGCAKLLQDINRYLTRSYIMVVFLCHSMFNPMTTFSFN